MREMWSAHVRGDSGKFERARLLVDDRGRFVLETSSAAVDSTDRAVIDRGDVERLADALLDEFTPPGSS